MEQENLSLTTPIETARVFLAIREARRLGKQRTLRVGEYRCGAQGRTGP